MHADTRPSLNKLLLTKRDSIIATSSIGASDPLYLILTLLMKESERVGLRRLESLA